MALQEASLEKEGRVHKVDLLQMDNAVLAFCYEVTMKIGTLAISTPGLTEGVVGTSSVLLGGKYLIAARALAERSAAIFKKMSLDSLNTTLSEGEALRVYSEHLDKVKSSSLERVPKSQRWNKNHKPTVTAMAVQASPGIA